VIEIRTMTPAEVELVDRHLPLDRLDQPGGEWLVAWSGEMPVGHAHVDWRPRPAQIQNVFVAESHRRRGIASRLSLVAEERARARGHDAIALDVDVDNTAARRLYERLGYRERGTPPRRVHGTIVLRGAPFEVDAVLVDLVTEFGRPVDFGAPDSSSC
jgi:GNAT superfamily N-acetyltransferase